MDIENRIEHIKKPVYIGMMVIFYVLYIGLYFGVTIIDVRNLDILSKLIRLFVCAFLVLRFNPLKHQYKLREFDRELIFASAVMLLTDLGITQFVVQNLQSVKKRVTWSNTIQEII